MTLRSKFSSLRRWVAAVALMYSGPPAFTADTPPDWEREARLSAQAEETLFDGEIISFDSGDRSFLAIDLSPTDTPRGIAVILHGRGLHPNWPKVANPLRIALSERGFRTIAIQMPVLDRHATYYDYESIFPDAAARIDATVTAISRLTEPVMENRPVVLIAHSCSVHMSMHWIKETKGSGINAFVGIGMGATDKDQPMREPFPFAEMKVPVLDIYGSNDYPAVVNGAEDRFQKIRAISSSSLQVAVDGADHEFTDTEAPLIEAIDTWLQTLGY